MTGLSSRLSCGSLKPGDVGRAYLLELKLKLLGDKGDRVRMQGRFLCSQIVSSFIAEVDCKILVFLIANDPCGSES